VRFYRRSRVKSTRGHVRIEKGPPWAQWGTILAIVIALAILGAVIADQFILPALEDDQQVINDNRTWLEFAWTANPASPEAVQQLGERLSENGITRVYLESAAWLSDGTLVEGEYAAAFADTLRTAFPEIEVFLWLRMSGDEIVEPERQAAVIALAEKALSEWRFDGVQLNGRAVRDGSKAYIQLVRALREVVGNRGSLSVTVPPDRIPADPDVPIGTTAEPELTWSINYKQRVGLLGVDEVVVMAHASGLDNSGDYELWVAYQVESFVDAMSDLERPPEMIIALPTYDSAPEFDPAVETLPAAVAGVKAGIERAGKDGDLVKGVGLYEYKFTDSLEWALFAEHWLGRTP
jgi:hypothetical protein